MLIARWSDVTLRSAVRIVTRSKVGFDRHNVLLGLAILVRDGAKGPRRANGDRNQELQESGVAEFESI